jgi:hypothetical protein
VEPEQARIVHSELRVTALLEACSPDASQKYFMVSAALPCPLQSADRCTAENMSVINEALYTFPEIDAATSGEFAHVLVCHTQDSCSANAKQVRAGWQLDGIHNRMPRLAFGCDIHKCATASVKTFELVKADVSGMLAFAICMRGPGRLAALRQIVGKLCSDSSRLQIVRCGTASITDEAAAHRQAVLDLHLPAGSVLSRFGEWVDGSIARHQARVLYESLFNGDIRERRIVHYALPVEAGGETDEEIRKRFSRDAGQALLPRQLEHFPRHRWTKAHRVITYCSLLANTHGILYDAVWAWLQSHGAEAKDIDTQR